MADFHFESIVKLHESIEKISLENIASVTFNADTLKINFEVIVQILRSLAQATNLNQKTTDQNAKDIKDIKDLLEKLSDKQTKDKNDLNDRADNNETEIEKLKDALNKLLEAQKEQEKNHDELKGDHDNLDKAFKDSQVDLDKIKEKLAEHDRQIEDLLGKVSGFSGNSGDGFDPSYLEQKINKLNNLYVTLEGNQNDMKNKFDKDIADIHDLLDGYVKKDEFNGYKDQTNNKLKSHQDSIDELYKLLKDLEAKIGDKVDCETYDIHVNDYNIIKDIVLKLAAGEKPAVPTQVTQVVQGEGLPTKYKIFLEALMTKFPDLEERVKKIEKGLNDHLAAYKTFSDDATKKIANNEENLKNAKSELNKRIDDLEALIKALKAQISGMNLNVKVDKPSITLPLGNNDSSDEIRRIQVTLANVSDRLHGAEGNIADLQKLKERVNKLEDTSKDHESRIGALEEELKRLRQKLESLESLVSNGKGTGARGGSPAGDLNYDKVKQMIDGEINKLRDELLALIDGLRAELAKKADSEDLDKLEASILKKLDEIVGILMERMNKHNGDCKKALLFLEKKVNELTKILMGGQQEGGEDNKAILATMPWNPWACASCNSKPKEFPGALIDYKYWSKVPKRETSPSKLTQGKFGKGWPREQNNKRVSSYAVKREFAQTVSKFGGGSDKLPEISSPNEKVKQDSSRNE